MPARAAAIILDEAEHARVAAKGYLTVAQAADRLHVSKATFYRYADDGMLYVERIRRPGRASGIVRVPVVAIEDFEAAHLAPLRDQVISRLASVLKVKAVAS
ncbi:MAG: helix-turn-helix domain-containing protein [Vulcanimicrobiaceae bacterium]|jgi:excisionase family DNA binding protein